MSISCHICHNRCVVAINGHLRIRNGPTIGVLKVALFLTVLEIFTLFHFLLKSKMAAKSSKN